MVAIRLLQRARPSFQQVIALSLVSGFFMFPGASPAKAEEVPAHFTMIEDVLIEGVEVQAHFARLLSWQVEDSLPGTEVTLTSALADLESLHAFPEDERLQEVHFRAEEARYQDALTRAEDEAARALTDIQQAQQESTSATDSLIRIADSLRAVADSIPSDASYRASVLDAATSIESANGQSAQLDQSLAALAGDVAAILDDVNRAQATPPTDSAYLSAVENALTLSHLASDALSDVPSSVGRLLQQVDLAMTAMQQSSEADDIDDDTRSSLLGINEELSGPINAVGNLGTLSTDAGAKFDAVSVDLDEATAAGQRQSGVVLSDSYESKAVQASTSANQALASLTTIQDSLSKAVADIEAALGHLASVDETDPRIAAAKIPLTLALTASQTNMLQAAAGADQVAAEWLRVVTALSGLPYGEVPVQQTIAVAAMNSLGYVYYDLGQPGAAQLDMLAGVLTQVNDTMRNNARLVEGVITSVDAVYSPTEAQGWQAWDGANTGVMEPNGDDCRDEYQTQDGFVIYVHYGTNGDDSCIETRANDVYYMKNGNDLVRSGPGNDQIHLSAGSDEGRGEDDRDGIFGGSGPDVLYGSNGNDDVMDGMDTTFDADYMSGGPGSDYADMEDGDTNDGWFAGEGHDPEPKYDKKCYGVRPPSGCSYDYFESAGGYKTFPPDP